MTVGDLISHPEMGNGIIIEHKPHKKNKAYDTVRVLWVRNNEKSGILWLYQNEFLRGWSK